MPQKCSHVVGPLSPPLTRNLDGFWASKIPGGRSFIGGRLTMSLEDVIASFLSASGFLLKHVISSLHTLTKQPVSPLFTDLSQGQKCI